MLPDFALTLMCDEDEDSVSPTNTNTHERAFEKGKGLSSNGESERVGKGENPFTYEPRQIVVVGLFTFSFICRQ